MRFSELPCRCRESRAAKDGGSEPWCIAGRCHKAVPRHVVILLVMTLPSLCCLHFLFQVLAGAEDP